MNIKQQLNSILPKPGVYLFKNSTGDVLYIGKAKSLRSRVKSYFRVKANLDPAKHKMVPQITDVETIITDTETEALILEANLIRGHQPPYNIVLRDDKNYLFIKITTNEKAPRVFPVRRLKQDGARYFGPYSSAQSVRATLRLLRRLFPHHGEKDSPGEKIFPHPLFTSKAAEGINFCGVGVGGKRPRLGGGARDKRRKNSIPEVGATQAAGVASDRGQPTKQYKKSITNIIRFLKGDRQKIISTLKIGMKEAAKDKQFERAAIFRDQLSAIERLDDSQKVYLPSKESFDALSLVSSPNQSAVNVFSIRQGKLIGKNTFLLKHPSATPCHDVLQQFITQYYSVAQDSPKKVLIPFPLRKQPPNFYVPKRGRKKQLITMGEKSAQQILDQETYAFATDTNTKQALKELAESINIKNARRVEIYDISTIQGQYTTGSMAVFIDGQPDKSQYRKFRLRNINKKQNDYLMLQQVLSRRFSHRHNDWPSPNLILIDGGRGQLSAGQRALRQLNLSIPIASLAKKQEKLFVSNSKTPIQLPYDSPALFLIQRMRDEAHRFAISYHKLLRSKKIRKSILDEVPGLGPKTKKKLLRYFGSLKQIRVASDQQLAQVIGPAKTKNLRDYL